MACRNHPKRQREWQGNTGLCNECAAAEGSRIYDKQDARCAICGMPLGKRDAAGHVPRSAKLDHNHHTGQIRGVLCNRCNLGIGHFDEKPDRLRAAATYLEEWGAKALETFKSDNF